MLSSRSKIIGGIAAAVVCLTSPNIFAQPAGAKFFQEDFPFQGACISAQGPGTNVALKGYAIRIGNGMNVLWDTDLLRVASGWTGGYITPNGVAYNGGHAQHPAIMGKQQFGTRQAPAWANAKGDFQDNRPELIGPLPKDWCHWEGMYVNGMDVVLSYTVLGSKVIEQPSSVSAGGLLGFVRTFKIENAKTDLTTILADIPNGVSKPLGKSGIVVTGETNATTVVLVGASTGSSLDFNADTGHLTVTVPKGAKNSTFSVVIWSGDKADAEKSVALSAATSPQVINYVKGGAAHWPQALEMKGALNTSTTPDGAYATDSITAPSPNPWNRRVRFSGMDFFSDGKRAALCTHEGDIWIVEGIDENLENLKWHRFASGMYETLGLVIVNDVIYTSGRDQLTRYYDYNKDGEADYYENFNNDINSSEGFHEFVFDLQTDAQGNFYFAKANPVNGGGPGFGNTAASRANGFVHAHSGCLFKVSKDGKKFEIIARGLRAPNGIGISPTGQITTSDNEGTWVPATPINWIEKPGQFLGVINKLTPKSLSDTWTPPLAWISHQDYDNSGGGQIWVTSSKWGPYQGELLHESYGKSSLFLVLKEKASNGMMQGGVVKFPLKFTSSVMRARFNKNDGQLYVAGLREWQTTAAKDAGFDRVRYTGKKVYSVKALKVVKDGVQLTFTEPLASDSVVDLQNWSGKRWNYERAEHYGSPEFLVTPDEKGTVGKGREAINITGASLSADGKTVSLQIADFKPVMQESIKWSIKASDGNEVSQEIQHTIHNIPQN
ncbi:MAG: Large, multifunctional secreted protein [Verrucomicrobiales bacterium]|nr:Large, multifunctional secreted protein [Verrucomicrobiales bacterium]